MSLSEEKSVKNDNCAARGLYNHDSENPTFNSMMLRFAETNPHVIAYTCESTEVASPCAFSHYTGV